MYTIRLFAEKQMFSPLEHKNSYLQAAINSSMYFTSKLLPNYLKNVTCMLNFFQ